MILRADQHYAVIRFASGARRDQVSQLRCITCDFSVNVIALHRAHDKSGAGRYCRARAAMVKHWHAAHRPAAQPDFHDDRPDGRPDLHVTTQPGDLDTFGRPMRQGT